MSDIHYRKRLHEAILHVEYGEVFEAEVLTFCAIYTSEGWSFYDAFPRLRVAHYCYFIDCGPAIKAP